MRDQASNSAIVQEFETLAGHRMQNMNFYCMYCAFLSSRGKKERFY